ncbi:hypothetical protein [Photorhabdus heterorhabditis]|uniref:hypothetical protein n=1 Tax=Photorhabdus heterorhabditis TaxID=880156 RepID=UPI00165FC5EC|nr:hypothetical protein [Photorhabdus heterorhabditis]
MMKDFLQRVKTVKTLCRLKPEVKIMTFSHSLNPAAHKAINKNEKLVLLMLMYLKKKDK